MVKPLLSVTVHDDAGESFVFTPEDDLPAWAAKKITNPAVIAPAKSRTSKDADASEGDSK